MPILLLSGSLLLFTVLLIGCAGGGGRPGSEIPPVATTNEPLPQRQSQGSTQSSQTSGIAASRSEPIIYDYPGATRNLNAPTPNPVSAAPKPIGTSISSGLRYHTVMSGDTLWGLSRKYNVTIDSLRAANGLATDTIKPGQNLRIP